LRLDGIDLLRGVAVSSVVVYHFFAILGLQGSPYFHYVHSFGLFGVSLFFVISGYLIYRSVSFSLERYGTRAGLKHYTIHRLFRILPAYYVNLAVVLLMASFIIDSNYLYSGAFLKQIAAHLTFLSYLLYQDAGLGINGAYWTLSIEMLWYIVAPLLLIFAGRNRTLFLLALSSFVYLLALDFGLLDNLLHLDKNSPSYLLKLYYFSFQLPGQLSYFIAGILIYKFSQNQIDNPLPYKYILAIFIMILFIYVTSTFSLHSNFFLNNFFILFTVSTLFILLYQARPRGVKWMEWIGKISYSLYLWHMPLLFVMKKTSILNHLSMPVTILLFTFALLVLSTMSYYLVEEGGFQLRRKFEAGFQD